VWSQCWSASSTLTALAVRNMSNQLRRQR
jgi:hypothetical protein